MENIICQKYLYEHIYEEIKNDILNGKYKNGSKLPSKRNLSEQYSVSVITVENALSQLIAEGYINPVERSGYYVSFSGDAILPINHTPYKFISSNNSDVPISKAGTMFPFTIWSKLMRTVLSEQDAKLLKPVEWCGVWDLKKAISDYLYRCRGMYVNPEQIIIGSGADYFYNLIIQLLGRELCYAAENPCYEKILKVYKLNDVNSIQIEQDKFGLSANALSKSEANVVHLSPAHHFPTGIVMPISRRLEIMQWATEDDKRYIIEDDYDSEFRRTGKPLPSMFGMDKSCHTIYINTFSQTLAPSVRISYMCLPPQLLDIWKKKLGFYSCPVPAFEQYTLSRFISEGYFERHINRMRKYYRRTAELVKAFFSFENVTLHESDAGLHFTITIEKETEKIIKKASEFGISIRSLSHYYYNSNNNISNEFVVIYSNASEEKLQKFLSNKINQPK